MTASASRPSADLPVPDAAVAALSDAVEGGAREDTTADVRRIAAPVVAQFLRDLAAVHDRVSGGLLGELADELDPPAVDGDGADQ